MIMSKAFEELMPYLDKSMALQTARSLFEWDEQTMAPFEAADYTSKVIGIISDEYMKCLINDDVRKLIKTKRRGQTRQTNRQRKGNYQGA